MGAETDPFVNAVEQVKKYQELHNAGITTKSTIYFGAERKRQGGVRKHNGIDLGVPVEVPIRMPAQTAVLIGVCTEKNPLAGSSIGNGMVFFVPGEKPFFLLLAHLSPDTFNLLANSTRRQIGLPEKRPFNSGRLRIGTIIDAEENAIIAISGNSQAGKWPHVHVSATKRFMFGGKEYSANKFNQEYKKGTLRTVLEGRNFFAIIPLTHRRNKNDLTDFLDPLKLIQEGRLQFRTEPKPNIVSAHTAKKVRIVA